MYDPWGVGEAFYHGMRMFSHAKRATGRSSLLLAAVQDGDTVVYAQRTEAQRMRRLFSESGKEDVREIVKEPNQGIGEALSYIAERYNHRKGLLHFDHGWFEALYFQEINDAMVRMSRFHEDMMERRENYRKNQEQGVLQRWDGSRAAMSIDV